MKKSFLFKGVAVLGAILLLANVALPGLAYADEPELSSDWKLGCWTKPGETECSSDYGTYSVAYSDNNQTATFSNIELQYPGDDGVTRPEPKAGYYGVKIIVPEADTTGAGKIKIGSTEYTMSEIKDSGEGEHVFVYYWLHVTPEDAIDALNTSDGIITQTVEATFNDVSTTLTIEIDVNNLKYNDGETLALEVVDGKVKTINGGSTAWELGCWAKPGETECSSDYGTYSVAYSDNNQTATFSNIELQYPGDDGVTRPDSNAAYFGVKIIAPAADTSNLSKIKIGSNDHTMNDVKDGSEDDGRYFVYYWPHVTANDVETALADTNGIITETVIGTLNGIETTLTINIDVNNASFSSGDEVDLKTENGKVTVKDGEEIKQQSSGTSGGGKSSGGGSATSSKKTDDTKADNTKATTGDTAKVDENNPEENNEEKANNENKDEEKAPMTDAQAVEKFGQEQIDAYKWALENGITTMKTVEAARLDEPLTRAELAKMMVVYIQKVLEKDPIVTGDVSYPDVDESLGDLYGYIKLAYQYQIMGINADGTPIELFNPYGLVTRGEYATVFSRVLFGDKFNKAGEDFYTKHLEALKAAGILTNTIPTIQEMRGWVMLMMYRSSQNAEKIENVANTTETNEEEKADEETATASDETKSEANEEEKAEEATNTEATTGDVAETPATQESSETTAENTETTAEATTGDVAEAPTAEASTGDTASN